MSRAYSIFVDNIEALFGLLEGLVQTGEAWIFRGQADAQWELSSALERAVEKYSAQQSSFIDSSLVERDIMEMGRRILKAHPETSVCIADDLDLLAYIQHYGGLTRLLDFTDSFAIALFFAISDSMAEFATVWCLNRNSVNCFSGSRDARRKLANQILTQKYEENDIFSFAPHLLNERIVTQQGLFLMPCTLKCRLQQLLFDKLGLGGLDRKTLVFHNVNDLLQKLCCLRHQKRDEQVSQNNSAQYILLDHQKAEEFIKQNLMIGNALSNDESNEVRIIRFNIPRKLFMATQEILRKLNVSINTLFPNGVEGICRSLNFLASGYRHHSAFEKE